MKGGPSGSTLEDRRSWLLRCGLAASALGVIGAPTAEPRGWRYSHRGEARWEVLHTPDTTRHLCRYEVRRGSQWLALDAASLLAVRFGALCLHRGALCCDSGGGSLRLVLGRAEPLRLQGRLRARIDRGIVTCCVERGLAVSPSVEMVAGSGWRTLLGQSTWVPRPWPRAPWVPVWTDGATMTLRQPRDFPVVGHPARRDSGEVLEPLHRARAIWGELRGLSVAGAREARSVLLAAGDPEWGLVAEAVSPPGSSSAQGKRPERPALGEPGWQRLGQRLRHLEELLAMHDDRLARWVARAPPAGALDLLERGVAPGIRTLDTLAARLEESPVLSEVLGRLLGAAPDSREAAAGVRRRWMALSPTWIQRGGDWLLP